MRCGLLGEKLGHSYSPAIHAQLADYAYGLYEVAPEALPAFLTGGDFDALNVTIPYKESIIPFLNEMDSKATKIGAVNTIKVSKNGNLKGYNTDYYGFSKSLEPHLKLGHKKALILGTGGASKAIAYALEQLEIETAFVSRNPSKETTFTYKSLTEKDIKNHKIIVNCTPLGTHPNIDECPDIPYRAITNSHILFDLIYNPKETKFLSLGKDKNATCINGSKMLVYQANKAWAIWNL